MKSEDTIYDNEKTQYDEPQSQSENVNKETVAENEEPATDAPESKKSSFRKAAAGMGMGILMGSAASFLTSGAIIEEATSGGNAGGNGGTTPQPNEEHPWVDDQIQVATSVNDEMSFSQAFAAARAEVGAGGAFEWRGNVYNTYTAEEWNSMTPAQQAEYGDHFNWSLHANEAAQTNATAQATAAAETPADTPLVDPDPDVESLGVIHDEEVGTDIGTMTVGGQEVYLIDVDPDGVGGEFDYAAADLNNNGQIDDNEIWNVSESNISVQEFGSMASTDDSLLAANDGIDYANDDSYDIV